jgi:hypothetical protein
VYNNSFVTGVLKDRISALVFGGTAEPPPAVPAVPKEELERFAGERQLRPAGRYVLRRAETHLQVFSTGPANT